MAQSVPLRLMMSIEIGSAPAHWLFRLPGVLSECPAMLPSGVNAADNCPLTAANGMGRLLPTLRQPSYQRQGPRADQQAR
jgi:hypothetical protein